MTPRDTPENPYVAGKLFDLPGSYVRTSGYEAAQCVAKVPAVHDELIEGGT